MMPDAREWDIKSKLRLKLGESSYQMTPAEKAIREKLVEPVDVAFDGRQLTQVMQSLSEMTGIPIFIDPLGLAAEGLTSDQRINLNLNGQSVSLKSALNLMLEPLNMTYVIKDEVLKITSKNTTNQRRVTLTYPVRDLVTPIPNFVADYNNSGLAGALQSAYQANNSMLLVEDQRDERFPAGERNAGRLPAGGKYQSRLEGPRSDGRHAGNAWRHDWDGWWRSAGDGKQFTVHDGQWRQRNGRRQ